MVVRGAVVAGDSGRACGAGPGVLSANETLLLVPCGASGRLLYLDRATLEPWDSLQVAAGISRVVVAPGGLAAVLLPDSDRVAIVDLRAKRRVANVPTAPGPVDAALDAAGQMAFVLAAGRSGSAGGLLVISLRDGTVLEQASLPAGGRAVAVWPGRRKVRMSWVRASASGAPAARW
jgi:DNA-binding beta-propeller fold protein YncE